MVIAEKGLEQKARQRKRAAEQRRQKNPRQADLPDDPVLRRLLPHAPEENLKDLLRGDRDAAGADIDDRNEEKSGD
jgi:hypothetical protein